jgi:hypothetical protein
MNVAFIRKMIQMKRSNQYGINYMAARPKPGMNGNGQVHPWYKDKTKVRTAAGVAGFVIGSILTVLLISKKRK